MALLNKEDALFERDEKGDLLPVKVSLETIEDEEIDVIITPMVRGEIKRLHAEANIDGNTTKEQDTEIVLKHCITPKFTEDEVKYLKPKLISAIVNAILAVSLDISQRELAEKTAKAAIEIIDKQQEEAARKN